MENFFVALIFFAKAAAALAVYRLVAGRVSATLRQWVLAAISVYFLSTLAGADRFLVFAVCYALGFAGLGHAISRMDSNLAKSLAGLAGIVVAAIVMLLFKYPTYAGFLFNNWGLIAQLSAIKWIGLSYLTFRGIDLLLYAGRKSTRNLSFSQGVSYLLFFAPYVSGPINRFAGYVREQSGGQPRLDWDTARDCLIRISVGVIKVVVLGRVFYYHSPLGHPFDPAHVGWLDLAVALLSHYLYFYFDFSGYSDIAIALARLFGVTVPENFHFPFLARNIQDFWNRWHISLSHWCRDHIFFPLMRLFAQRVPWMPGLVASSLSIFVTFFFVGAWHGDALNWIFYGIFHGAGVALWLLYSQMLTRIVPTGYERLCANPVYRVLSSAATTAFVAAGMLLTLGLETTSTVLARIF